MNTFQTVKHTIGLLDFSLEGKILVKGSGRVDFINGLATNDIKLLEENHGCYAMFLNKLGKILSDCIVYKFNDFLLLNMNVLGKKNIIGMLREEAALGKSEVEDVSLTYALFSIQGQKSREFLNHFLKKPVELKKEFEVTTRQVQLNNKTAEIMIAKHSRTAEEGFDLFIPASSYKMMKAFILEKGKSFGIAEIDNETYEVLRLEAKKPLYGIDFDETNILPEITDNAVSYTKGCYVGQEIVVRVKNLAKGLTSKRLASLEIDSTTVPKNEKIFRGGKEAGFITSFAYSLGKNKVVALGFLKKEFFSEKEFLVDGSKSEAKGFL